MKRNVLRRQFLTSLAGLTAGAAARARAASSAAEQAEAAMSSRIESVETFVVSYPVIGEFKFLKTRRGARVVRDTVVVKITDSEGRVGWGQSVPVRTWSYETIETVRTTIDRYLGPAIVGRNAFDTSTIHRIMDRTIAPSFSTGQPICKAGIDLALFDLTGRILDRSAAERWGRGGQAARRVTLSWTVTARTLDALEAEVQTAFKRGYRNFNLKVGERPDFDVALCRQIRRLAPKAFIWADANGQYDLTTALSVAPKMADAGIAALEQPCPANRLSWYRRLRRQKALPILMDEPIVSLVELQEFWRLGLLDGVAMKVSRCGGLTESRRIVEWMQQNGLLFFASGLTDPDLSLAASLLLFGSYGLQRPAALNGPQFLSGTILASAIVVEGDQAQVPQGPGLAVTVDEAKLKAMAAR